MEKKITNFGRFYKSFNELPCGGDRDEFKRSVVRQYTWGRTDSLRDMTVEEYNECCSGLEKLSGRKDRLKKERSVCLKLMQRLGVDTSDWARVDNFCLNARIAGKKFAFISLEDMEKLAVKLRAIGRNGGLGHRKESQTVEQSVKRLEAVWIAEDGDAS